MNNTKLIIGLGNIGKQYENTRHNAGFLFLDAYATTQHAPWHEKSKFKACLSEFQMGEHKILLAKPTTFMNLSGEAVRTIKDFYKLEDNDILVIHDELDLPFGTLRTRVGGSSAGNNGIKSISAHIGENFARLRVGIGNELLPKIGAHEFVLTRFAHDELTHFRHLEPLAFGVINDFIKGDFASTTHTTLSA